MTIGVLIADDEALVRAGIRKILESSEEIEVIGEAIDGMDAVSLAQRLKPAVVLMDIRMPNLDGLSATREILAGGGVSPKVLILTTFGMNEHVFEALEAGASGFLLKDSPPEDLVSAVRVIARGDALLDPKVTRAVIGNFVKKPRRADWETKVRLLTTRELDVLKLLGRGLSNAEMAEQLVISAGTVKTHVGNILMKLEVRDRVHAVIAAFESGFIEAESGQGPDS